VDTKTDAVQNADKNDHINAACPVVAQTGDNANKSACYQQSLRPKASGKDPRDRRVASAAIACTPDKARICDVPVKSLAYIANVENKK
jgi:hypothetical protein